jgi:hypothetical protein
MKRFLTFLLLGGALAWSCSSHSGSIRGADGVAWFGGTMAASMNTASNPDSILAKQTVKFKIPNPLIGPGMGGIRRADPNHESLIYCSAVLLDSLGTEADISAACKKDSLGAEACATFRAGYLTEKVKPGQFRIRISMESGFSPKSLDPAHWVIYLLTAQGVAIEPLRIDTTPVAVKSDSIYSSFNRLNLPRSLMRSDVTLSFNRVTFFKEDLFGSGNPYIVLEMVSDQKTVARVAWERSGK